MGRSFSGGWRWQCALLFLALGSSGCGGHKPPGQSGLPARISLTPSVSASLAMGNILTFSAAAQNNTGSPIGATFTFQSSDTSILNIAPNGVACGGRWNATYTTCIPGAAGVVQVTASALGATSVPTIVFVHQPIDHITVSEDTSTTPPPLPGPCFTEGQSITLQATAWSQNADITQSVGTFAWAAASPNVVTLIPIKNFTFNVPTNLATATANDPGLTQIFASVSGVISTPFQQVTPSPNVIWDFFETCPVQNILLQLGPAGSQQSGQTTFAVNRGTPQTVIATVTDVQGYVLAHAPLTWSSSASATVAAAATCNTLTCTVSTPSPGAGTVTASCTPPTCNIGFPLNPPGLAAYPQYIPTPVYGTTAISGVVSGTPAATSVFATSLDCASDFLCGVALYDVPTTRASSGSPIVLPSAPGSILFDPAGDKAYMGSTFGASIINPANIGTSNPIFTSLGAVTGTILATSQNGTLSAFSDTVHTPNQVYLVNAASNSISTVALPISGATRAAFSPDGLETFVFGYDSGGNPNLYIYSTLLGPQTIPLPAQTTVNSLGFSPNSAFAYVVGSVPGNGASLTIYNTCNNTVSTPLVTNPSPLSLPTPTFVKVLPNAQLNGLDSQGNTFPDGVHILLLDTSGFEIVTQKNASLPAGTVTNPGTPCPQTTTSVTAQRIDLHEGVFNPLALFVSPDATQVYIVASNFSSILVYNFNTGAVSGIPLAGDVTPITADITVDGTQIYVAGSDGQLHQISTGSAVDLLQIPFANLSIFPNPFCSLDPSENQACALNFIAVRP